jgi:recombination protein RecA
VQHGLIDKAGSWYSYGEDRIGQGKENVREYLKANPETSAEIEAKIRAILLPEKEEVQQVADDAEAAAKEA